MFSIRTGSRRIAATSTLRTLAKRSYASRIDIPFAPPPVPVIDACPAPACQCREMPAGLEIEREQNLNGSMAAYAEQVLISTGKSDWKSRIEEDEDGVLVRQLKGFLGPKGKYSDPYHNVMLTNSSFTPTAPPQNHDPNPSQADNTSASAYLLPSFQYLPTIPATDPQAIETLIQGYIKPSQLHQSHARLTREEQALLKRQPPLQKKFPDARPVGEILILICGHGGRDERCGILGPVLQKEFEEKLARQNVPVLREAPGQDSVSSGSETYEPHARVGLISHIGGHKWAGNVIIYIPPLFSSNPLAGKGIWYGRVEPGHVEGIVSKTVLEGKVIKEFFRGGVGLGGELIRL